MEYKKAKAVMEEDAKPILISLIKAFHNVFINIFIHILLGTNWRAYYWFTYELIFLYFQKKDGLILEKICILWGISIIIQLNSLGWIIIL